ncbi:splicing factor 3A subunit 1-like isoform X1 [Lytechinus pictus]|uniref:splicing factor 3A subunit 1-like isoform X1 n=1 Tax=Lytechinus pictus TaxID=7653 RepID=UPI0030B9CCDA
MPELIPNVVTISEADEPAEKTDAPASKPMVGIIYPPPEVRNIVDKTASFVARNGPEFESRIRQNEISNAKFNFLNPGDPYHAYYRHKVKEFQEGKAVEPSGAMPLKLQLQLTASQPKPTLLVEPIVPKEPPPEFEFVADPPSINAFDLDVVKLTAQFVARNGGQFLTNLMNREQRNYIFDFLRPQHSMFNYFTKLVEQYIKVLIPPKDLLEKLTEEGATRKIVMEQVTHRVEWEKHQERLRKKDEEEREKERVAYSQIDWHDFVVVETVDYQPDEEGQFPPPLKPSEIGSRILAEERYEQFGEELAEDEDVEMEVEDDDEEGDDDEEEGDEEEEDEEGVKDKEKEEGKKEEGGERVKTTDLNTEVQDMEEGSDSDMEESDEEKEESAPAPPAPPKEVAPMLPPLPPQLGEAIIKKDYNPKMAKQAQPLDTTKYLISPITGEKIAADKMQEHMRIGLLDPRWVEERSRQMSSKAQEEVYAAGSSIEESLKNLAERRTDIFGEGDIETQIGKKIGEEEEEDKNKQKVIWDGHSASMESTTRKAQAGITLEDQINAFHKSKGLLPDKEKERIGPQKTKAAPHPPKPPPQPPKPSNAAPVVPAQPRQGPPPQPPPMPPRMPLVQQVPMVRAPAAPLMQIPSRPIMNPFPGPPRMPMQPQPRMQGGPMGNRLPMPPPGPPQMMRGVLPEPPRGGPPRQDMGMDEPPAKRQKTEDDLIPEEQFLATHKGTVMFNVVCPLVQDKPEWKLHGQRITLNMPLTDQVSVIKAKLFEQLGIPAGKQKLQHEGLFIKDSNSLGFYNFMHGTVVQLQLKERGGRRR